FARASTLRFPPLTRWFPEKSPAALRTRPAQASRAASAWEFQASSVGRSPPDIDCCSPASTGPCPQFTQRPPFFAGDERVSAACYIERCVANQVGMCARRVVCWQLSGVFPCL